MSSRKNIYTTKTVVTSEGEKTEIEDVIPVEEKTEIEDVAPAEENIAPVEDQISESHGRVACVRLRVRKEPSTESEVLGEVVNDEIVKIITSKSTAEFYRVITAKGLEGYCMKSFIILM